MKSIYFLMWFVLFVGCEVGQTEMRGQPDTKTYAQKTNEQSPTLTPTTSVCKSNLDRIGAMDLASAMLTDDQEIAIPRGAHDFAYYLSVMPYSKEGDEMTDEQLVWGIADKTLGKIISHAWNNNTIEVKVQRDYFDADDKEPQSVAGVCVQDPCETFESIVYPRPSCAKFRVVGLINLEGTWRIMSSMLPMAMEINVYQKSRALTLTADAEAKQNATLHNNVVTLATDAHRYECTLTSRSHCDGIIVDVQTDKTIGTWTADRL